MQINVIQNRLFAFFAVAELNVLKVDAAVGHVTVGIFGIGDRRLFREHLRDTLAARRAHGEHDKDERDHHQVHQNVHAVGQHAGEVALGQLAADHHIRAEPADGDDRGIDRQHHQRRHRDHQLFRLQKQRIEVERRALKLGDLVVLAHKRLDNADGFDILLHAGVELVVLVKDLHKILVRLADQKEQYHRQKRNGYQINTGELGVDHQRDGHGNNQTDRRAEADAQDHLIGGLQVGDVGRHAGDKTGGGEFVDIRKRKGLDIGKHRAAEVACKACRRLGAEHAAHRAAEQRQQRAEQHQSSHQHDMSHIGACGVFDPVVDHRLHQQRDQHFHQYFQYHKQGRRNGFPDKAPDMYHQRFQHNITFCI